MHTPVFSGNIGGVNKIVKQKRKGEAIPENAQYWRLKKCYKQ